ncbi:MAG TPA: DUF1488 domain-containing protein [Dongiaceae bacterium]|jgi:hypothetical protein
MKLDFPNPSRSYDARRQRVRFWAHDEALEIPFFIEVAALCRIDPNAAGDEDELLRVFDVNRSRICAAATRIYTRYERASYTLSPADLS